jgi:rhodanese-related sulfurtransferase
VTATTPTQHQIDASMLTGRLRAPMGGAVPAVLDVRTPGEFESGHIPGAVNIPVDQLDGHAVRIAAADPELVLVCQSGGRATAAHQRLSSHGARRSTVLTGGMASWAAAGGETQSGRARWTLERQVRLAAGSLVLGGILGSFAWPAARVLSGVIGGGLVFSAVTNTCGMGAVLAKLPYNKSREADIDEAVTALLGS